jgi:hypothetical protein
MKLGTLLAAGKCLVLGRHGKSPYRADKQFYLPKFGSPNNPFASANRPGGATPPVEPAAAPVKAPITVVAAKTQKLPTFSPARRAVSWASKLNPISKWRDSEAPPQATRLAVQGELSLDTVKVLRNDLADADVEVVPLKSRPVRGGEVPVLEPVNSVWEPAGERSLKMRAS